MTKNLNLLQEKLKGMNFSRLKPSTFDKDIKKIIKKMSDILLDEFYISLKLSVKNTEYTVSVTKHSFFSSEPMDVMNLIIKTNPQKDAITGIEFKTGYNHYPCESLDMNLRSSMYLYFKVLDFLLDLNEDYLQNDFLIASFDEKKSKDFLNILEIISSRVKIFYLEGCYSNIILSKNESKRDKLDAVEYYGDLLVKHPAPNVHRISVQKVDTSNKNILVSFRVLIDKLNFIFEIYSNKKIVINYKDSVYYEGFFTDKNEFLKEMQICFDSIEILLLVNQE